MTIPSEPAFTDLLAEIRKRRSSFSANKKIDDEVVARMRQAGVYRAMVARRFGGEECTPAQFFRIVEEIARADGSAGWVASFGVAAVYLAALPLPTLREIYASGPDIIFAGGNFPSQRAERTAGGLKVNGRWPWASGCSGADVIGVGIEVAEDDGTITPLLAIFPKSKVTIDETWNVNGMRGTGSFDIVIKDGIVPDAWTLVRGGKPSLDEPLYRYPVMALSSQVLSVVTLGIARSAIDALMTIAAGRTSLVGGAALANRPSVQSELARAEASLRSARAFFYELTEEAFARICDGESLDQKTFALLRAAANNAAHTGAAVARTIYTISGTTGIFTDDPIARAFQDAMIIPQHAFLAETVWQSIGAALLGIETPGFS